jgi:hypothetical protein
VLVALQLHKGHLIDYSDHLGDRPLWLDIHSALRSRHAAQIHIYLLRMRVEYRFRILHHQPELLGVEHWRRDVGPALLHRGVEH